MLTELPEQNLLNVQREIEIAAPPDVVFEAMLELMGPSNQQHDGTKMPLKLEAWPGGRWFRDLGNNTGHFWGHVQVIKPPTLLEITGPLFMSYPAISHVQYRVVSEGRVSRLMLVHRAIGEISLQHRNGVSKGWEYQMDRIKSRATR